MIANGRSASSATPRPPNPSMPYRDDCWSEGETSALVDAWGDRYVDLNRGHLRQKNWQEVADAVNTRRAANRRPPRTDVQCKYRIDTLKKKYKAEKARISAGAAGTGSQWRFFDRLDKLITGSGSNPRLPADNSSSRSLALAGESSSSRPSVVGSKRSSSRSPSPGIKKSSSRLSDPSRSPPLALPLPFHRKNSPLPTAAAFRAGDAKMKSSLPGVSRDDSKFKQVREEDDEDGSDSESFSRSDRGFKRGREMEGDGDGVRQLSWAINRFADIYERVELSKQRQMVEMEKQRMEFAKALEFQRMKMFVDSQVQLEKIKRAKRSDNVNYNGDLG